MSRFVRSTATALFLGSLTLLAAGCKPEGDAASTVETAKTGEEADAAEGAALEITGLESEKAQVSYMIGMEMAKSLEPVKDEVDLDTLTKAMKTVIAGEKPLMTEEQAKQVGETFGQKMQAKQIADMMAKAKKNAEAGAAFLAENAKKPGVETTASGLQYKVVTAGDGPRPSAEDTVKVHYKGTLLDGTSFDDSYERGEPVTFPLSQVVPGWQEGIALMPVGSKYTFWIPSKLGYGERGTPGGPIGPNATLVFEVELLDIVEGGGN